MAQDVGSAPTNFQDWNIPDEYELIEYLKDTQEPICWRPGGIRPGAEKRPVLDEQGNPVFRKTKDGKLHGQLHKYVPLEREMVRGERSPRGHIRWHKYTPETEADRQERERLAQLATFQGDMARELVKQGISAKDFVQRVLGIASDDGADEDSSDEDAEFPEHRGGGHYQLSDGSVVKGKAAALEAQAALDEAKEPPG